MTPDDRIQAAELALGLLDGAEQAAGVARLLSDPAFALEVAWWRDRLAGLFADYDPLEAPEMLASRIRSAIENEMSADGLREMPVASSLSRASAAPRRWPYFAGSAALGAIAASVATVLLVPRHSPPAPVPAAVSAPILVAAIAPAAGEKRPVVVAWVDLGTRIVRIAATVGKPADHSAELWRIGGDGVPQSLGLLAEQRATSLRMHQKLLPNDVLAISIEPLGGSPTGKPTGPVIASGKLQWG